MGLPIVLIQITIEYIMKIIYILLFFITGTITAQEKQTLCRLDQVELDTQEITDLNTLFVQALAYPNNWSNVTLQEIITKTHNQINVLPKNHRSIFKRSIRDNASNILNRVCDTKELEPDFYHAISIQDSLSWEQFQKTYCNVIVKILSDKLPAIDNPTPYTFLTTHLADENLKKKSLTWVLPALLVMMYGKKIQRINSQV